MSPSAPFRLYLQINAINISPLHFYEIFCHQTEKWLVNIEEISSGMKSLKFLLASEKLVNHLRLQYFESWYFTGLLSFDIRASSLNKV